MDFANAAIGFGDVIITYAPQGQAVQFHDRQPRDPERSRADHELALHLVHRARGVRRCVRQHPPDRSSRAAIVNKAGDFRFNAGLFAAHSIDSTLDNEGWIARDPRRLLAAHGRQPAALRRQLPAPQVPEQQRRHDGQRVRPAVDQPARPLPRPALLADDRRPLRRHRQFRGQERRHLRPRVRRHLQVAARRGRGPVSEVERL